MLDLLLGSTNAEAMSRLTYVIFREAPLVLGQCHTFPLSFDFMALLLSFAMQTIAVKDTDKLLMSILTVELLS